MKKIRINILLFIGLCLSNSLKTTNITKKENKARLDISNESIKNIFIYTIKELKNQIQTLEQKKNRTKKENDELSILRNIEKNLNQKYPEINEK